MGERREMEWWRWWWWWWVGGGGDTRFVCYAVVCFAGTSFSSFRER